MDAKYAQPAQASSSDAARNSASTLSTSFVYSFDTTCWALYNLFTCKNLNLDQYRALLAVTFVLNVLSLMAETVHMVVVFLGKSYTEGVVCLIATVLTLINCFLVLKLIVTPTTRSALLSSAIILVLEVVYIVQMVLEADSLINQTSAMIVTTVMLFFHLCTALLLYRYWEFVMYQYDDSAGLQHFINNFPDSVIHSSDVLSQLRSPLVEDKSVHRSNAV